MFALIDIILVFVVLPVLCLTAIIIAAIFRLGRGREPGAGNETRMIQEMHRGLESLERRIESLETLILEHDRHTKGSES